VFKDDYKFTVCATKDYFVELEVAVIELPQPKEPEPVIKVDDYSSLLEKTFGNQKSGTDESIEAGFRCPAHWGRVVQGVAGP
jgi:hypothetical protein